MRLTCLLPLGLLLAGASSLPGQTTLSSGTRLLKPVPIATTTIPAMNYHGDLGGVLINLAYERIGISFGGAYLGLRGPYNIQGNVQRGSWVGVLAEGLPAGSYTVRFDLVNVSQAAQFAFFRPFGTTVGNCTVNALSGYANVQSCTYALTINNGKLELGLEQMSGSEATLMQVAVLRWQ